MASSVALVNPMSLSFGGICRFCQCDLSDGSPETRTNGLYHGYHHCSDHVIDASLHRIVFYHRNKKVKIEDFLQKFSLNNLKVPRTGGSFSDGSVALSKVDEFFFVRYSESNETWVVNVSFCGNMSKDIKLLDLIHSGIDQSTIDDMIEFLNEGFYSEIIDLLEAQLNVKII